ncbi:hypothetical protein ElyMa_003976000 [Elysia marginata]|uniref:Uncharacterized protein n=1 Tax=Elysia marginata TaxID=1093978 RepID=A0AAV4FWJ0_9GAST|nr:hypothetical protein ElyMa_003976000 [Elysia marginata]
MANRNTTLAKLWVDDGQGSPIHVTPVTPSKSNTGENHEFLQFFKNSGLDSVAKDLSLLLTLTLGAAVDWSGTVVCPSGPPLQLNTMPAVYRVGRHEFQVSYHNLPEILLVVSHLLSFPEMLMSEEMVYH